MKKSTGSSSPHSLTAAATACLFLTLMSVAFLSIGQMVGDLLLFLLIGIVKPAGFIAVGVALYRFYKRPSRLVQLSPPFTPLNTRSS